MTIAGRVFGSDGNPIRKAVVTINESNGETRKMYTANDGTYFFEGVEAGQIVTVSVFSKYLRFTPQVIDVGDSINNLDFFPAK